jgi:methionine-rich copper-binding protein CopC
MNRIFASLAALAMTTGLFAGVALAHAQFVSSSPKPGETVAKAPAAVLITFSEDLGAGATGAATDASGATVSTGATIDTTTRTNLSIALKAGLANGVYKVSWHSVSADDGDALDGTFFFGVGVPAPSTSSVPTSTVDLAIALLALAVVLASGSFLALRPRSVA